MSWTTPKTDWTETTRWDKTDLNRIVDNLIYLRDYCGKLFRPPKYVDMRTNLAYEDDLYARDFNAISENLRALNTATFNYTLSQLPTFYPNQHLPTYTYFNEVETLISNIKSELDKNVAIMPKYPITLGIMRGVKT